MFISTGMVTASEEAHKKRVTGGIFRISAMKPSIFMKCRKQSLVYWNLESCYVTFVFVDINIMSPF